MGRALGKILSSKGANVVLVARDPSKLALAKEYIAAVAKSPTKQRFLTVSADVTDPAESQRILDETTTWNHNQPPDIVWANAGSAHPSLFTDTSIRTLRAQMDINYWGAAYLAHATLRQWFAPTTRKAPAAPSRQPRHFIITSSSVAYVGVAGYAPYSPAKAALRNLADALCSEVNLYNGARRSKDAAIVANAPERDVNVHIVIPGTILTEGFDKENASKHPVTKVLEEGDPKQTEDEVAAAAIKGLERGEYMVTTQWLGYLMKVGMMGGSARGRWLLDTVVGGLANVAWLFIGPDMNHKVYEFGKRKGILSKSQDQS